MESALAAITKFEKLLDKLIDIVECLSTLVNELSEAEGSLMQSDDEYLPSGDEEDEEL